MYGICILTPRPTSSTSMSDASAARSTANKPIRLFIPYAASGFASVLLAKTLRSSTLRLALICVGIFGAAVCALFSYVYWSTASYVRSRSDRAITAEHVVLRQGPDPTGPGGPISPLKQPHPENRFPGRPFFLACPTLAPGRR